VSARRQQGATLVVGLMLLAMVTLLGLAGASGAHVERQLAQNEQFRENAASAASAGIEYAIRRIVTSSPTDFDAAAVPANASATLPGAAEHFETVTRFMGFEETLPQAAGARLVGAHFEITSTGYSRHVTDRQRVGVMFVVAGAAAPLECTPALPGVHCHTPGELVRLSWQRLPSSSPEP
jgi:Tfp pilus assembly protein PilX